MKIMLAFGLGIMLVASAARGGDAKADLAKLQGNWVAEMDGKKGELTLAKDNTFTFKVDKETFKGTFKIDPSKKPKEMDLTVTKGKEDKEQTSHAIYELVGDTLKWCAREPGQDGRATEFPAKEGPTGSDLYLVFKRVK